MSNLNQFGSQFHLSHLEESDCAKSPFAQFDLWIKEALAQDIKDANAMALATVDAQGMVSNRMVLLKYYDEQGLVFFTNYNSPKSQALQSHPQASVLFWWPSLERQLRVSGHVQRIDEKHSDKYFASRDKDSNIAATVSNQSQVLTSKQRLVDAFEHSQKQNLDKDNVPRPADWGGYRLQASDFEFWQGGPHRLHDRIRYRQDNEDWKIERLYP